MTKAQQVHELLLAPIVCDDRQRDKPIRQGNTILTGQRYASTFIDEDMSDFAVGFYEILYNRPILDNRGFIKDLDYAGDTMNSFETTARRVLGRERPPEVEWPCYLREYKQRYRCLANFWVLPLEMGRTLKGPLNKARRAQDYMDRFLRLIRTEAPFGGDGGGFFQSFTDWDDFVERQFLRRGYLAREGKIKEMSGGSPESFISGALAAMEDRARDIAESEYMEPLWSYFERNGVL